MEIPEYVYGIPTQKAKSKERVCLIRNYYSKLWKKLQKEGRSNSVFNKFLGADIFIVEKESDKKTIYAASKNGQSTFAVKHLEEVMANATKFGDGPIYDKPHGKTQKANGYKKKPHSTLPLVLETIGMCTVFLPAKIQHFTIQAPLAKQF